MIITNKVLPRRTFLRGVGAAVALPLLDSMVPVLGAAARIKPARRLGVVYVPNGVIMDRWTPAAEGGAFELTPTLQPLASFRNQVLLLSGLNDNPAIPLPNEGAGDHARAASTFLTGVHVRKTEGTDIQAGISMDQIAARELGKETQIASLELTLEYTGMLGACDAGHNALIQEPQKRCLRIQGNTKTRKLDEEVASRTYAKLRCVPQCGLDVFEGKMEVAAQREINGYSRQQFQSLEGLCMCAATE